MVLDLRTQTVSGIPIPASVGSSLRKWGGGVVTADGKVYGIPLCREENIMVLDTVTWKVSGIRIPEALRPCATIANTWSGGVADDTGKVYGIPANAGQILVLDTATGDISGIAVPSAVGGGMWCGGVTVAGKVYGLPADAGQILVFDPFLRVDLQASLAAIGPLTLKCLDGSKFEILWPETLQHGTKLDLCKLSQQAHPESVLGSAQFTLIATGNVVGGSGNVMESVDASLLDRDLLYRMINGVVSTTLAVVFE
jgi:hypothetical protein